MFHTKPAFCPGSFDHSIVHHWSRWVHNVPSFWRCPVDFCPSSSSHFFPWTMTPTFPPCQDRCNQTKMELYKCKFYCFTKIFNVFKNEKIHWFFFRKDKNILHVLLSIWLNIHIVITSNSKFHCYCLHTASKILQNPIVFICAIYLQQWGSLFSAENLKYMKW